MSYATIKAAISTAIGAVAGISGGAGKVIDHEPDMILPESYVDTFGNAAGTLINAWTISLVRSSTGQQDPGFRFVRGADILVRARYGLQESSGSKVAFENLTDAVETALRGSTAIWLIHPEGSDQAIQVESVGEEMHGAFLVHIAELRFTVEEVFTVSA